MSAVAKRPDVKKFFRPLYVIIAIVILLVLMSVGYYNSFTTKSTGIEGQWQQVEVQYQRRVDLIPNLVNAVKGAQLQEQKIINAVTESREKYVSATTPENQVKAANELEGSLGRLIAIFENYPQIRSNENILRLQDELAGTENRVAVERRRYNELVQEYNRSIRVLPGKLFAGIFNFDPKTYFEAEPGSSQAPEVNLP